MIVRAIEILGSNVSRLIDELGRIAVFGGQTTAAG
jgi:hypothetical protein